MISPSLINLSSKNLAAAKPGLHHPTRLLVPVDFSSESVAAMRAAGRAAEKSSAEITLLNVVEDATVFRGHTVPAGTRKLKEHHRQLLQEIAHTELPPSVNAEVVVAAGDPAGEIIDFAASRHIDCILVGKHRRSKLLRWFGGRTAELLAISAPCRVIEMDGQTEVEIPAQAI